MIQSPYTYTKELPITRHKRIARVFCALIATVYAALCTCVFVLLVRLGIYYSRLANSIAVPENAWKFKDGYWVVDKIYECCYSVESGYDCYQYPGGKVRPMELGEIESFKLSRRYGMICLSIIITIGILTTVMMGMGAIFFTDIHNPYISELTRNYPNPSTRPTSQLADWWIDRYPSCPESPRLSSI